MKMPKLKLPSLSLSERATMLLMHLLYGSMALSHFVSVGLRLYNNEPLEKFQLSAGFFILQTWFFWFQGVGERKQKWKALQLVDETQRLTGKLYSINALILQRLSRIHPSVLKEAGISIKKNAV